MKFLFIGLILFFIGCESDKEHVTRIFGTSYEKSKVFDITRVTVYKFKVDSIEYLIGEGFNGGIFIVRHSK